MIVPQYCIFNRAAVYDLLSWVWDNDDQEVDDLMQGLDHLLVHVQS